MAWKRWWRRRPKGYGIRRELLDTWLSWTNIGSQTGNAERVSVPVCECLFYMKQHKLSVRARSHTNLNVCAYLWACVFLGLMMSAYICFCCVSLSLCLCTFHPLISSTSAILNRIIGRHIKFGLLPFPIIVSVNHWHRIAFTHFELPRIRWHFFRWIWIIQIA